jgi:hypothetical protein
MTVKNMKERRVRLVPETDSPVERFFTEVNEAISDEIRPFLEWHDKWIKGMTLDGL